MALSCAQWEELSLFADSRCLYTKRQTLVCDSSCIGKLGSTYSSLSYILTCCAIARVLCLVFGTGIIQGSWRYWKWRGTSPAWTPWQVFVLAQSQRSTLSRTSASHYRAALAPRPDLEVHSLQSLQPATTVHAPIAHWTKQLLNSTCVWKVRQFFCLFSWVQMLWILDLITNLCYQWFLFL